MGHIEVDTEAATPSIYTIVITNIIFLKDFFTSKFHFLSLLDA